MIKQFIYIVCFSDINNIYTSFISINLAWCQCPCSQGHRFRKAGQQVIMSLYSIHFFLKGFLCVNLNSRVVIVGKEIEAFVVK